MRAIMLAKININIFLTLIVVLYQKHLEIHLGIHFDKNKAYVNFNNTSHLQIKTKRSLCVIYQF